MANQSTSINSLMSWLAWVLLNGIAGAIGVVPLSDAWLKIPGSDKERFLAILIFSLVISVCQGAYLSGKISRVLEWIVSTFLAIPFGLLLFYLGIIFPSIFDAVFYRVIVQLTAFLSIGFTIGLAQWYFALRHRPQATRSQARLWILISTLGWAVGVIGGAVAIAQSSSSNGLWVAGGVALSLYGAITGTTLAQLVQKKVS
ncbi:hypothetical protein [Pantanalinema sp. GBBB05]|uniref:hypothetical protein n=1 Tax=Pantanalinema sp. GBBB05 TaxID=2604139 RepID=UPI001D58892D|nr:hypothetical protein [Pantanalinema sp. GBBB05]